MVRHRPKGIDVLSLDPAAGTDRFTVCRSAFCGECQDLVAWRYVGSRGDELGRPHLVSTRCHRSGQCH